MNEPTIKITVRLSADLHRRVTTQAKADKRSLNSEFEYLLELALRDMAKARKLKVPR